MKSKGSEKRKMAHAPRTRRGWFIGLPAGVLVLVLVVFGRATLDKIPSEAVPPADSGPIQFTDARQQAPEFIGYHHAIALTADQQKLMDKALSSVPAPCCSNYSIATCCCPCNLAKSAWGLSKFLIARQHADATQVKTAVNGWLRFINRGGFTGDACFTRGCDRPFERNGCGGMDDRYVR